MMDYDINEQQTSIDNMSETLYERMTEIADERPHDAVAIYEEWVVDGQDPENDDFEFIFLQNFTLID